MSNQKRLVKRAECRGTSLSFALGQKESLKKDMERLLDAEVITQVKKAILILVISFEPTNNPELKQK